ncbi:hypothetical protein Kfla_4202 [Kribbella flavida DSM 17836]|uniref:Uncharacterized protein n=1 Tax=Kribbella flavida (strain DSM 17836 / JCM 10339 / NBRC 14399) TaxID=479435 RepID=D2PTV9_KRIFD|nr:hypothetical protein Kfla_4202 [Kribbella flavida DSM 17836]
MPKWPLRLHANQMVVPEHPQMLRHRRLRSTEGLLQLADGQSARREALQQMTTRAVRENSEEIHARQYSCSGIYLSRNTLFDPKGISRNGPPRPVQVKCRALHQCPVDVREPPQCLRLVPNAVLRADNVDVGRGGARQLPQNAAGVLALNRDDDHVAVQKVDHIEAAATRSATCWSPSGRRRVSPSRRRVSSRGRTDRGRIEPCICARPPLQHPPATRRHPPSSAQRRRRSPDHFGCNRSPTPHVRSQHFTQRDFMTPADVFLRLVHGVAAGDYAAISEVSGAAYGLPPT